MNFHQSDVLLQDLSNSFHRWLNLFVLILPEFLNNSWWCFSSSFSEIWRLKKSFTSISYPFSQRFVVLVQGHPLIIVLIAKILFLPPESIISDLFILSFQSSFSNLTGASFKWSLISHDPFVLMYLDYLKYCHSFHNSYPVIHPFTSLFFNSYGGSFKILLPLFLYQFIRYVILPGDHRRHSQVVLYLF